MTAKVSALTQSRQAAEAISASGARAKAYASSPVTPSSFIIAAGRGSAPHELRLWMPTEKWEVHTNRRHKQAVLHVEEPRRSLRRVVSFSNAWYSAAEITGMTERALELRFPVNMPPRTRYHLAEFVPAHRKHGEGHHLATIEATTPRTKMDFLVGIDEVAHFVSLLPKPAASVDEAHDLLRPARISKGTLRQGEFFFRPVRNRRILRKLEGLGLNLYQVPKAPHLRRYVPLEQGSSHHAALLRRLTLQGRRRTFVAGAVIDIRGTRHKPLLLAEWHEVIRNREVISRQQVTSGRLRWD